MPIHLLPPHLLNLPLSETLRVLTLILTRKLLFYGLHMIFFPALLLLKPFVFPLSGPCFTL